MVLTAAGGTEKGGDFTVITDILEALTKKEKLCKI
ncbi:hypothetical protein P22_0916 [Propionispora sp. 2/2-37]|nr:hypothetical protein P22_0916 [Propionispora sp. 2/2-37]